MLKIGDKVRFLNESGEGVVAGFQSKNTVLVLIEDGFEIPMRAVDLVPVYEEAAQQPVIVTSSLEKAEIKAKFEIEGIESVLLALSPQKQAFSKTFTLYLINNSYYQLAYVVSFKTQNVCEGLGCDTLQAGNYIEIGTFEHKDIERWEHIIVQLLFYKKGTHEVLIPIEKHIAIKNKRLEQIHLLKPAPIAGFQAHLFEVADFKTPSVIGYADYEPTFSPSLLRSKTKINQSLKSKEDEKSPIRVNPKNGYMEIDLHIEELTDNYGGLSNGEIVQIQLKHCKKAIDMAIQRNVGKITLIHGVGNGTLKREVRNLLKSYDGILFYDAPMEKYGYGATEVQLR